MLICTGVSKGRGEAPAPSWVFAFDLNLSPCPLTFFTSHSPFLGIRKGGKSSNPRRGLGLRPGQKGMSEGIIPLKGVRDLGGRKIGYKDTAGNAEISYLPPWRMVEMNLEV